MALLLPILNILVLCSILFEEKWVSILDRMFGKWWMASETSASSNPGGGMRPQGTECSNVIEREPEKHLLRPYVCCLMGMQGKQP